MGHSGFLNNVSITLIDKINGKNPKNREEYWRRTLKNHSLDLILKTDQPHIAKNAAYGAPFYGIV